jgi:hypothetical protein
LKFIALDLRSRCGGVLGMLDRNWGRLMNAHVQTALEEIAKKAGAIVRCKVCRNEWIAAGDSDAASMAHVMAANAWKGGEFRSASFDEVRDLMTAVLRDANAHCFSCGQGSN